MTTPTTAQRRDLSTAVRSSAPGDVDVALMRTALSTLEHELEQQMHAAMATLQELREDSSLTDPDVQAPLMTALHALDAAERSAIEVADALTRLDDGTFGVCGRCGEAIPAERLELRPAGRFCVACSR
jgi:RNA polymerase-binding transcription factor DksA